MHNFIFMDNKVCVRVCVHTRSVYIHICICILHALTANSYTQLYVNDNGWLINLFRNGCSVNANTLLSLSYFTILGMHIYLSFVWLSGVEHVAKRMCAATDYAKNAAALGEETTIKHLGPE